MTSTSAPRMTSGQRIGLWILALAGLAASSTSLWVHYQLLADPRYTSFCDINSALSCTQAYLSPYGTFAGVPVALFGVIWFVIVFALLAIDALGSPRVAGNVPGYLFAWSTMGLAVVLYLGYAAFVVLQAICVLCVVTYAAVSGIFLLAGAATRFPMTTLPRRAWQDLRALVVSPLPLAVAIILAVGVASAIAFFPREAAAPALAADDGDGSSTGSEPAAVPAVSQDQRSEVERWFDEQPRAVVPVDSPGVVTIVKFNDYQCPPCGQTYRTYKPILAKWTSQAAGKVKFLTKDFPLEAECNASAPGGSHLAACEAAVAVRLAREKGRADQMEDWLFSNQPRLTPESVRQAARDVGGVTDFDARYKGVLEDVKSDAALGGLLGVQSTPTFFINGVKIPGGLQPQYLEAVIEYELRKAEQASK